jgi:uncharacterized protein (TIGR03083 family)
MTAEGTRTGPATVPELVDALEHTVESMLAAVGGLSEADFDRPTDLPGWSVKDNVSHIVGLERILLGDPVPELALPEYAHVSGPVDAYMELPVEARRAVPGAEVAAELRETLARRLASFRGRTIEPTEELPAPTGSRWPAEFLLRNRTFDVWAHEQDVRRAVGRPGNLDGPGARVAQRWILRSLPKVVAKTAGAPPGSSVEFRIGPPLGGDVAVVVDADGRGSLGRVSASGSASAEPTVRLSMSWPSFAMLSCGRRTAAALPDVIVDGDQALAARVLDALAITP